MSKKLIQKVTKVLKSFNKAKFTFVSGDCDDCGGLQYDNIEGHEIVIGDDNHREQWSVVLNDVKGPSGDKVNGKDFIDVLTKCLGQPTDEPRKGCFNWEIGKNLLVVACDDSIEFYQDYVKV